MLMEDVNLVINSPYAFPSAPCRIMQIRGGTDWKFSPGSEARGAAARNAGGLFTDAFSPKPLNPAFPDSMPGAPNTRIGPKLFGNEQGNGNCGNSGNNNNNNDNFSNYNRPKRGSRF